MDSLSEKSMEGPSDEESSPQFVLLSSISSPNENLEKVTLIFSKSS